MPFFVVTTSVEPFPHSLPAGQRHSIVTATRVAGPCTTLQAAAQLAEQERGTRAWPWVVTDIVEAQSEESARLKVTGDIDLHREFRDRLARLPRAQS